MTISWLASTADKLSRTLPSAVLGRAYGRIKGGQHLKYPQNTPLANLLLTLLDRAGVPLEKVGNSTGQLTEV